MEESVGTRPGAPGKQHSVSILMPTYNDEKYIGDAIESVLSQTHPVWELIIVNDGSSDGTRNIARGYLDDPRIHYIEHDTNRGQLNALYTASSRLSGEYVTMLHSDDLLLDREVLKRNADYLAASNSDGIYADIVILNRNGEPYGRLKTPKRVTMSVVATLLALGGSNLLTDIFFVQRDVFLRSVLNRYILWNMPYWFHAGRDSSRLLHLSKAAPWYGYRVYDENYVHSESGKFEASNGCIRTCLELTEYFDIRLPRVSKYAALLSMKVLNQPEFIYLKRSGKRSQKPWVRMILENYYRDGWKMSYLDALVGFYDRHPSGRESTVPDDLLETWHKQYLGKDARQFFHDYQRGDVPDLYPFLIQESEKGFSRIILPNPIFKGALEDALRFLNIAAGVVIEDA